jgi:peptide-methionine (S)-S-oxide reductase
MRPRLHLSLCLLAACAAGEAEPHSAPPDSRIEKEDAVTTPETQPSENTPSANAEPALESATFGAGCFWCVEAVLEQVEGVVDVSSGYMGGTVDRPTYKAVCTGTTGHAEVVQVRFDPARVSYAELLDWFWRLHDPTTLNRQGGDVGTQYRSAIFVHSEAQRETAERSLAAAQEHFDDPIVTAITDATTYWSGEDYHQDYYRNNKSQGYCRMVIRPKLKKLELDE